MKAYISSKYNVDVREVLEQLRDDIKNLPTDIEVYARKVFFSPEIRQFIIEANQANLEKGLRPDDTYISKTPVDNQKSEFYERFTEYNRREGKSGYKQSQTQFVDLYKTGFFYKSLEVKQGSNELLEISTDPKAQKLEAVWGDILGISADDLNKLIMLIRPYLVKFVKDKLTLR